MMEMGILEVKYMIRRVRKSLFILQNTNEIRKTEKKLLFYMEQNV